MEFQIWGLVEKERGISFQEFASLSRVKGYSDIHCVTGWSKLDNLWEGLSTNAIGHLASVLPEAKFVMVHSVGGFTTNLRLSDFLQPDVLFALTHNDQPLAPEHGYPVRPVVPRLYFWKSAKWVIVEFMAKDRRGFWESMGYHMRGDPWQKERYSD